MFDPSVQGKQTSQTETDYKVKSCCGGFEAVIAIALITIGALALTGKLNAVVAGGSAIGLASVALMANIAQGKKTRDDGNRVAAAVLTALISIAIIVVASLALKGILPAATLSKVVIGTAAALFAVSVTTLALKRIKSCCANICASGIAKGHKNAAYRVH